MEFNRSIEHCEGNVPHASPPVTHHRNSLTNRVDVQGGVVGFVTWCGRGGGDKRDGGKQKVRGDELTPNFKTSN